LKPVIAGQNRAQLQTALLEVVRAKPEKHDLCLTDVPRHSSLEMSRVGG
jgi:hypothetical protein